MNANPRNKSGSGAKNDPNLGQKESEREKAELDEEPEEEEDGPNLGQKEAEREKAELDEEPEEEEDELKPMTET